MARPQALRKRLLEYALAKSGAWLDHPWGEDVAKVGKKVVVFFGTGFGAKGWVSIQFNGELPFEMLRDWIDESYATVAPKKLSAHLSA